MTIKLSDDLKAAWRPSSAAITAAELAGVLARHEAVVIHFWAEWNRVDRQMDLTVEVLQEQYRNQVQFYSCDADDPRNRPLWSYLRIATLPSLVMFNRFREPRLLVADRHAAEVAAELDMFLSPDCVYRRWWQFWKPDDSCTIDLRLPRNWLSEI